jgi:hypothetical protein
MGRHVVRSLLEFTSWYNNLPDSEVDLLKELRKEHLEFFCGKEEEGECWADELQNLRLPVSLSAIGTTRYRSRNWGNRPDRLGPVAESVECGWIERICLRLNNTLNLSLALVVASGRSLSAVRGFEAENDAMEIKVVGASSAARTAAALRRQGINVEKLGQKGWRLPTDAEATATEIVESGGGKKVVVLHCMDNECFFSMDRDGSTLPKKSNKKSHIQGRLVVAKGDQLAQILEYMTPILNAARNGLAVVVTPHPRFLVPCCLKHAADKTKEEVCRDAERTIGAVWSLKRELMQLVAKAHLKNVVLVSPLEVLGVRDCLEEVMGTMEDGVHLKEECQDKLAGHIIQKIEEFMVSRKRGPTERSGPADKRSRSSSNYDGSGGSGASAGAGAWRREAGSWGRGGYGNSAGHHGGWRGGSRGSRGGQSGRHYSTY